MLYSHETVRQRQYVHMKVINSLLPNDTIIYDVMTFVNSP